MLFTIILCFIYTQICTGYCDEPVVPANGSINSTGSMESDTVTYFCNEGYNLSGNANRTCQSNGSWSGILPECIRMLNAALKCIMADCIIMALTLLQYISLLSHSLD